MKPIPLTETQMAELFRLRAENKRLSALADKWYFECDEMREDNKRLESLAKSWEDIANALSTQDNKLIAEMTQQAVDAEEAITSLLAKLESAEKDAARWKSLQILGRVDSHSNVIWFAGNPHSFPPCTEFYAMKEV